MILQTIHSDKFGAMKDKDTLKYNLLCTLYAECYNVGKNNGNRDTTDDECYAVIKKFIKNNTENIQLITDSRITEKFLIENAILTNYLPKQLTSIELECVVSDYIKSGLNNVGSIMSKLKSEYTNQYDSKEASSIIKDKLNG